MEVEVEDVMGFVEDFVDERVVFDLVVDVVDVVDLEVVEMELF